MGLERCKSGVPAARILNTRYFKDDEHACIRGLLLNYIGPLTPVYQYGGGGPIHISSVHCVGNETSLLSCRNFPPQYYCSHGRDVGVRCRGMTIYILCECIVSGNCG